MKTCTACKTEKPLDAFRPGRNKCYACQYADHKAKLIADPDRKAKRNADLRKYGKDWKEKNPEKYALQTRRKTWKAQGIDPDLAEAYYQSHHGLCDICGGSEPSGKALAMDHCHTTGRIRGMLCAACNTAAGLLKDNPRLAIKLAAYLTDAASYECDAPA